MECKLDRRGREEWGGAGRRRGRHGKRKIRARRGDAVHNWADQDEKEVGAGREEREEHSRVRRRRMDAWVSGCGWVRVGVSG